MGKGRIHLDATKAGWMLAQALCGHLGVETTADVASVTCKSCLARMRRLAGGSSAGDGAERAPAVTPRAARNSPGAADLRRVAAEAFLAILAPTAGPPPRLDPPAWATSCKGGEARCHQCVLCEWEKEADRWAYVNTGQKRHRVRRLPTAPKWPSLAAALAALVEWERHNRWGPSAMGPILARIEYGRVDGGVGTSEDPVMRRASEMVRVRQALEAAYPDGVSVRCVGQIHGDQNPEVHLPTTTCVGVLLARTAGVLETVTPYEDLSRELLGTYADVAQVPVGELQAIVKRGRRAVVVELAARGLIPMPKPALGLDEAIEAKRERLVVNG